jgi:hypothetical protein
MRHLISCAKVTDAIMLMISITPHHDHHGASSLHRIFSASLSTPAANLPVASPFEKTGFF